jgi:hypothetical protein
MRKLFVVLALVLVGCATEPEVSIVGTYDLHTWNRGTLPRDASWTDRRGIHNEMLLLSAAITVKSDGTWTEHLRMQSRPSHAWTLEYSGTWEDVGRGRARFREHYWARNTFDATLTADGMQAVRGEQPHAVQGHMVYVRRLY